ncbi:MAG: family 43 glycosylhydrolase [Deltaproteobacteria bacterium]|nr:family 43 glycosylhydrolase [Deltaproteobacteria bacterium]MBK8237665.1 family 43 glycosylhydrolase [Deltaproteobacteria bacterium]MBK8719456.1 family 43 glycosylhydrolase [Deltaproteobacteria bacterium]MBP7290667.1 family 43 glycosylhydrolase [Nannocystaceae bacterium]
MARRAAILVTWTLACSLDAEGGDGRSDGSEGSSSGAQGSTSAGPATTAATTVGEASSSGEGDASSSGEAPPEPVAGITAEYFAEHVTPIATTIEPEVVHAWGMAPPWGDQADHVSVRWRGFLTAPSSDLYTILVDADDGVRVRIDGTLVIDDWQPHYVTRSQGQIALVADLPVAIEIEYFEWDLEASIALSWSRTDVPEQTIPPSAFTTLPELAPSSAPKPPYRNPVVGFDCPDPGVVALDDDDTPGYAMVCTGGKFRVRRSAQLVTWHDTDTFLLPDGKPPWADNGGRNWAPELHHQGDGLVAYFTTVDGSNRLCIGAAWADTIDGPWTVSDGPLVQHNQGVIDATVADDGGTRYLVYKIDGNSVGAPTPILARELLPDGSGFAAGSSATQLLVNEPGTWEGGVIEAPWLVLHDGEWFLFYSGNVYDHRYRTGVARAPALLGPYQKHGAPILGNNERWVGPGHGSVVHVGDDDIFVYHAWTNAGDGTHDGALGRQVLVDRIVWGDDGWPAIHDGSPSRTLQPWPE